MVTRRHLMSSDVIECRAGQSIRLEPSVIRVCVRLVGLKEFHHGIMGQNEPS